MPKICDNLCVGQIIRKGDDILLIERHNYPQVIAPVAGHLDGMSFDEAAIVESQEEANVHIAENELLWRGEIDNPCKRTGGSHHLWQVYGTLAWSGEPRSGSDAKRIFWASTADIARFAARTEYFMKKYSAPFDQVGTLTRRIFGNAIDGSETDPEWKQEMGLEPVWYFIFKKLGLI